MPQPSSLYERRGHLPFGECGEYYQERAGDRNAQVARDCRRKSMRPKLAAIFALVTAPALAADAPAPGGYIAVGGSGNLTIQRDGAVSLSTLGANGHTCSLDGGLKGWTIQSGSGGDPNDLCVIGVKRIAPDGLRLTPADGDACRAYCGARATMDGDFYLPPKGCADAERDATRKAFKALYDSKRYAEALAKLAPLPKRCEAQIGWLEMDWILNDLALTHYRAGDPASCLADLKPMAKDIASTDDDLRDVYPPSDFESVYPAIKAARANAKLCKGG